MQRYQNYPVEAFDDLKQLCRVRAETHGENPLLLQRRGEQVESISYARFCKNVHAFGTALAAHGLMGKRVILMGENGYEWVLAYMTVVCGGGTVIPLDAGVDKAYLTDVIQKTDAAAIICAAELVARAQTAGGKNLCVISFLELDAWIKEGLMRMRAGDRAYLNCDVDPDSVAMLLFTTGILGNESGVMLSHRNLCFDAGEVCRMIRIEPTDVFFSALPLHYAFAFTLGWLCPFFCGAAVSFGDGLHTLSRDMQAVRPTVLLCIPLLVETIYEKLWTRIRNEGMEKHVRTDIALSNAVGSESLRARMKRKLFQRLHRSFGGRLRLLLSGGSRIAPDILSGMRDLGFSVIQSYGRAECAPIAAINRDRVCNDDSVGMAMPNVLVDIYDPRDDGVGEIRVKGNNVMLGYFNDPKGTARVMRDGWLYTGELGYMDAYGFLYWIGQKKNRIVASNGKNVFPEELEAFLDGDRCIKESMVMGVYNEKKRGNDILAVIRPSDAVLDAELDLEMRKAVSRVNGKLPFDKRIDDYWICCKPFPRNTVHRIRRADFEKEMLAQYQESKRRQ